MSTYYKPTDSKVSRVKHPPCELIVRVKICMFCEICNNFAFVCFCSILSADACRPQVLNPQYDFQLWYFNFDSRTHFSPEITGPLSQHKGGIVGAE